MDLNIVFIDNTAARPGGKPEESLAAGGDETGAVAATSQQLSEFVVSVCAVLENTGVDHAAKNKVMNVVSRLVDRLHKAEDCLLYTSPSPRDS